MRNDGWAPGPGCGWTDRAYGCRWSETGGRLDATLLQAQRGRYRGDEGVATWVWGWGFRRGSVAARDGDGSRRSLVVAPREQPRVGSNRIAGLVATIEALLGPRPHPRDRHLAISTGPAARGVLVTFPRSRETRRRGGLSDVEPTGGGDAGGPPPRATGEASDLELTRRLRDGEGHALAVLYDRYAAAVHGVTRAVLRDDGLAEEATHDVFLHLWQQPASYEAARGPFPSWLLRVARNRAIDLLRGRREQPFAVPAMGEGEPAVDGANWLPDPDPDPGDQVISHIVQVDVRAALTRLAPEQRRVLELAYFSGFSQSEIAAHLDRPLGTVKTQIRTAMRRLAAVLVVADPTLGENDERRRPTGDPRLSSPEARSRP